MPEKKKKRRAEKEFRNKLFQNEPNEHQPIFHMELLESNYKTVYYMIRVLVPVAVVMLVLSILIKDSQGVIVGNGIMSTIGFLLFLFSYRCPVGEANQYRKISRFIMYTAYALLLFWGMHMAGYQSDSVVFIVDMVTVIFVLAFQFLTKYQMLLSYYLGGLVYLFFFTPYGNSAWDYAPKIFSPILLIASAFFLARLCFLQYIERFLMSEKLKDKQEVLSAELFHTVAQLRDTERCITTDIIKTLVKVLEYYDAYTRGHSNNVAEYAVGIAQEMNLQEEQIDEIMLSGLVHDIGKILIPVSLLNKPETFSGEEYELVKQHSQFGFDMLIEAKELNQIAKIVLHHHERWDGNGYPHGLMGDEIPLGSQILMVADAWDAMTSERIYKKAKSKDEAKRELISLSGSQFSPEVTDAFLNRLFG